MNQTHDFDSILTDWLAGDTVAEVPPRIADGATDVARRTRQLRPLPGWVATLKGDTMLAPTPARRAVLPGTALAVITALLIAMLAVSGAIVGSRMLLDRGIDTQIRGVVLASPAPPAGGLIAFDANGDIYVVDATGNHLRRLTDGPTVDEAPAWSPDGTRIAFWSSTDPSRSLVVLDVISGERTDVVPNAGDVTMSEWPSGPVWSPDGTWLAYAVGGAADGQVVAADGQVALVPATGGIPPVYFAPANVGAYEPRFSPDGSQLAFTGVDGSGVCRLYVADRAPDGTVSNPRVISHGTWDFPGPDLYLSFRGISFARSTWSPDGRSLGTDAGTTATGGDVLIVAADGTTQHAPFVALNGGQAVGNGLPSWSPDGASLAYMRPVDGGTDQELQLTVAAPDGTAQRVLDVPLADSVPGWSPDATRLAVQSSERGLLYIVDPTGLAPRVTIAAPGNVAEPTWQRVPVVVHAGTALEGSLGSQR